MSGEVALEKSQLVRLHGLQARADMNGRYGIVYTDRKPENGRFGVRVITTMEEPLITLAIKDTLKRPW